MAKGAEQGPRRDEVLPHRWDVEAGEAVKIQNALRELIVEAPLPAPIELVGATDVSYNRGEETMYAAVVVLDVETLEVVEVSRAQAQAEMPYIPGFLSFREMPALIAAWEGVERKPQVVLVDGQGIAHPRKLGIATHFGLWFDIPTIGCGKSKLYGSYEEPDEERGSYSPLEARDGEVIGQVLRTRTGVSPIFLSIGHRANLEEARELVLRVAPRYRIPVPIREAHDAANEARRQGSGSEE